MRNTILTTIDEQAKWCNQQKTIHMQTISHGIGFFFKKKDRKKSKMNGDHRYGSCNPFYLHQFTVTKFLLLFKLAVCVCIGVDVVRMENYNIFEFQKCNTEEFSVHMHEILGARTLCGSSTVFFPLFFFLEYYFPVVKHASARFLASQDCTHIIFNNFLFSSISYVFLCRNFVWRKQCYCRHRIGYQHRTDTYKRDAQIITKPLLHRSYIRFIVRPLAKGVWHCFYGYVLCRAANLKAFMPFEQFMYDFQGNDKYSLGSKEANNNGKSVLSTYISFWFLLCELSHLNVLNAMCFIFFFSFGLVQKEVEMRILVIFCCSWCFLFFVFFFFFFCFYSRSSELMSDFFLSLSSNFVKSIDSQTDNLSFLFGNSVSFALDRLNVMCVYKFGIAGDIRVCRRLYAKCNFVEWANNFEVRLDWYNRENKKESPWFRCGCTFFPLSSLTWLYFLHASQWWFHNWST